ncbi:peptidase M50 [Coriobacterium glomerans PW2]|uniref:Peptidase M50 n=1 Tax=Coriobacterium glomerans (strain ATCC 49209 / DSM 20642 / JCM 10262 / PW2) TaxID=700015 RepID=F2N9H5_CORGP|nr:site-2 protease family protein [Coriobacterium glomerans]AEB07004.1 peptidase M50 [Coriobacterium glomerans PW2]
MHVISAVLSVVFWGVVLLSPLVFVHEGGHFLAARACGVRVTEFFLGLPFRWRLSHTSKRSGTRFGVTPILLGGYAMISGMDPESSEWAPQVLRLVHEAGSMRVADIARALSITEYEAGDACAMLAGWGSLAPVDDGRHESKRSEESYPSRYASVARDAEGNTVLDGRRFDRHHATSQGEPWEPPMEERGFFERERSRTYLGSSIWKRACMLLAGIAVNILSGVLLIMCVYSIIGVTVIKDVNAVGGIKEGSAASAAGIEAGDRIISLDGETTETWTDILHAIKGAPKGSAFSIEFEHDRELRSASITLGSDEPLGIQATTEVAHLNPVDSAKLSISYLAATGQAVVRLVQPQHTMEVLDSSTSIVGISVMSAQAASVGIATFLQLAGLLSFSLAFMNLLPIPPLDGGKLVFEVIQALLPRKIPLRIQNAVNIAGIFIFALLFIYLLRGDILRIFS